MAKLPLRDPKTGRFIAGPDSISNILPAIAEDFRQISLSFIKLGKLDEDEKKQRKLDEVKQRQDRYAERFKQAKKSPSRVKTITKQRSIIDMIKDLFANIFKFLVIGIGVIGLAKLLQNRDVVNGIISFIKNLILSTFDLFVKVFGTIQTILSDTEVRKSLFSLVKTSFEFIGDILVKSFDMLLNLLRDTEVRNSFVDALIAIFKTSYDVLKAGLGIVWQTINENFQSVVQTIVGAIGAIALAIKEGIVITAEILSDRRIIESLKNVIVATFSFVTALLREDYVLEGEVKKSGWRIFGEWVGEAAALTALFLYWKMRIFKASLGLNKVSGCNCPVTGVLPDKVERTIVQSVVESAKYAKDKVVQGGKYVVEKGKQVVLTAKEYASRAAKFIGSQYEKLSSYAKSKVNQVVDLGKAIFNIAKERAVKAGDFLYVLFKNSSLKNKVIDAFGKAFLTSAKGKLEQIFARVLAKAAVAQALAGGFAATGIGVVVSVLIEIAFVAAAVYDLAQIFFLFYDFMFAPSDEYPKGYFAVIKAEWDKTLADWKKETKPAQQSANPPVVPAKPADRVEEVPVVKPQPVQSTPTTPTRSEVPVPPSLSPGESAVVGQGEFKPYPISNVSIDVGVEKRDLSLKNGGPRKKTDGVVIHHTGGNSLQVAVDTLKQRGLSYHYLVDRDGRVIQVLPDNLIGWHSYPSNKKPEFNNSNTISISMVAADDTNVTAEQIAAATSLESMLSKKYGFSKTNVYGHGEVSSAKHPKEGFTIANAIRTGKEEIVVKEMAMNVANPNMPQITPTSDKKDKVGETLQTASNQLTSGLRVLEDLFINGRPSFTDMSTVINQNNTYSRPGGDLRDREARAIKFLIERQTT